VPSLRKTRSEPLLSPDKLRNIVEKRLPAWFKACASDTEAIVMHEAAFGTSRGELFLFACAIKYAAQKRKTVHVIFGSRRWRSAESADSSEVEVHREVEENPVRRPAPRNRRQR
jgi:hypothetical protein